MKRVFGLLAAAILCLSPVAAFAQGGVAGEWELSMSTPQGNTTVGLKLALAGDKLSGVLTSPMGAVPVSGTAAGNDVKATAEVAVQGMNLTFEIGGKVNGDAMDGTVKVGDFGEFPFTGKRAAARITDLNGKWDIKLVVVGMGEIPATAVMKQDGDKVTGTLSGPAGDLPVAGTVTGRDVKIDFEAETPQGKLPVSMTGSIGETSITGKASIAGMGEADWTATRAAVQ